MTLLGIFSNDPNFRHPEDLARLHEQFDVRDFGNHKTLSVAEVQEKAASVEILLLGKSSPRLTEHLAKDMGKLRCAMSIRGSLKPYIARELIEAGLLATNWGDTQANVAEGAMALLLASLKQLPALDRLARTGEDIRIPQAFPCRLEGRDVGLYGFGFIARHMARMLQGFGARVAVFDPFATDVPDSVRVCSSLKELFASCQIISIHCGLNEATQGSVTQELLELLPRGGILVNTARGAVVDEAALASLVREGRLLAGLDVIENEKEWRNSPFSDLPGTLLTHHNVSSGKGYPPGEAPAPRIPGFVWTNLENYLKGQPLIHHITLERYDLMT